MRLLVFIAVLAANLTLAGEGRIEVGGDNIRESALKPFQATWSVVAKSGDNAGKVTGLITETLSLREVDGKKVYHRLQVSSAPDGVNRSQAEVTFSAKDLAPVTSKAVRGGEPAWELRFSLEDGATHVVGEARTQPQNPMEKIDRRSKSPGFDGSILGLVLAALPLKEGYQADLPILWVASASEYKITARVTGQRSFPDGKGGQVQAWAVAVDWLDLNNGQTFDGGEDGTGGTYYVVPNPPEGFPHVPVYVNSSANIGLMIH